MDEEGFRYPRVDMAGCSECGRCQHLCPMVTGDGTVLKHHAWVAGEISGQSSYPQVYAAWNKNELIRGESSSGGVFTLLAQGILQRGGVVVGAGFGPRLQLCHMAVDTADDLKLLRGSKYLQSDMVDIIGGIKSFLDRGREVLFSGTPCQVAGLNSSVGGAHELLLTCDLVCHGVPSDRLFRNYIQEQEAAHGAAALGISFRDKKSGWKRYSVTIKFANGAVYEKSSDEDGFMRLFLSDLSLRPSCYVCPFSTIPRQGDITLGDYWGVAAAHPGIDDDGGVTLVLLNSVQGLEAFETLADLMTVYPSDIRKGVAGNPCIIRPVSMSPGRRRFMQDLGDLSMAELCAQYLLPPSWGERGTARMKRFLSRARNLLYS